MTDQDRKGGSFEPTPWNGDSEAKRLYIASLVAAACAGTHVGEIDDAAAVRIATTAFLVADAVLAAASE